MTDDLTLRDARHVWHPYTQHAVARTPLAVASAQGAVLRLTDGTELIDAISSWWTCLHGHGHPALVAAAHEQMETLDHVLFAGATHEPAVALAEELVGVVPDGLNRVFFSDDGSTAVEVALKIARQAAFHRGERERTVFVAFEGGYHGDTVGAMSVGDPDPYFVPYGPMLFDVRRVPVDAAAVETALAELGPRAAGVIVEPLVQGAGGFRMHTPELLRAIRDASERHGVPMIADEVMTGFGRTGALFACELAGVRPDLLCLAKGLTGGTFPMAVTLATDALFDAFWSDERSRMFFHGHSFTGHPVGCAIARASLALCRSDDVPGKLDELGRRIEREVSTGLGADDARRLGLRRTGGIVAFDLPGDGYLDSRAPDLAARAVSRGVLLRPLGPVIYAMPPAATQASQADRIAEAMVDLALAAEV